MRQVIGADGEFVPVQGLLALLPSPISYIKASFTCSGNWLGSGNKVSTRAPQSTGHEPLEKGLCPEFKKILRKSECRVNALPGTCRDQPRICRFQRCDLSLSHQCALLSPKLNCLGSGSQKLQEAGAGRPGLWGKVPKGYLTAAD